MSRLQRGEIGTMLMLLALSSASLAAEAGHLTPGRWDVTLLSKVYAHDGAHKDQFSSSVDISGDLMVSTAREDDDLGDDSGSAYSFEPDPVTGEWLQTWKFLAFDGLEHDYYGEGLAVAADVVAVTSDRRQAVYVYHRDLGGADTWGLAARLDSGGQGPGTDFGWEADIDDAGTRMVVAARGKGTGDAGLAFVFERSGDSWAQAAIVGPSDGVSGDGFSSMVSISPDGNRFLVGAEGVDDNRGSAYVFDLAESGGWIESAKLTASDGNAGDFFGRVVSIDGDVAVIGSPEDGDIAFHAGAAYVFERNQLGEWIETAKLVASDPQSNDFFGRCVAARGDLIGVAAPGEDEVAELSGAAYFFRRNEGGPNAWGQTRKLVAEDSVDRSRWAYAMAFDVDRMVIGADFDDDGTGTQTGSAYVYDLLEGPASEVSGSCPGTATVELAGVTPGGRVLLLLGQGAGEFELPASNPCAGTTLDLDLPRRFATATADSNGEVVLNRTVQGPFCGKPLQGLDLTTCGVTALQSIPSNP